MRIRYLIICSLLVACGPEDPALIASTRAPIVNGEIDTGHPSVGMVRVGNSLCTGTLVGYRSVLTAAHCIKSGQQHRFVLGSTSYDAKAAIPHGGYDPNDLGVNDVGVLLLHETPTGVSYSRVYSKAVGYAASVTLVGFGLTGWEKGDAGTKRKGDNRVLWKGAMTYSFYTTWFGWAQVCNGDSGGPAFSDVGGKELVVGVHSWTTGCDWGGHDMRTDVYMPWLKQVTNGDLATESSNPTAPKDTDEPLVTIVSPSAGATLEGSIDVEAKVVDDGQVVEVQLYVDGALTQSLSKGPYRFSAGVLPPGPHSLRVVATDDAGNKGESSISITVGKDEPPPPPSDAQPPSVVIVSPNPNAIVPTSFAVRAQASDNVGVVAVALVLDGQVVDLDTDRPFEFQVESLALGPHSLEVRARDAAGNEGRETTTITVSDAAANPATGDGGCAIGAIPLADFHGALALLLLALLYRRRA